MKPEDREFMEVNRHYVESYQDKEAQDRPLIMPMRLSERLLEIVRTYFNPSASPDLWCADCEQAFLLNAYLMYDQYLNSHF